MKLSIPHLVYKANRDGTTRAYWEPSPGLRKLGFQTRTLGDDAITQAQALNERAEAARRGEFRPERQDAAPGSVEDLIQRYKTRRFWTKLAPRTQEDYEEHFTRLIDWAGADQASTIDDEDTENLYEALAAKAPVTAAYLMRVGRLLWNRAKKVGVRVTGNPFAKMDLPATTKSGNPWPAAAVEAFAAQADALGLHGVADAVLLNSWIGQREADVLALKRTIFTDELTAIRQKKGGAWVVLKLGDVAILRARLAEMAKRQEGRKLAALTAIVNDATCQPYNANTFRHDFARVRERLAARTPEWLVDYVTRGDNPGFLLATRQLQFKNLRHTAVLALRHAGATWEQIASITGHTIKSLPGIVETYSVRTAQQAASAFAARVAAEQSAESRTSDRK